MQGDLLLFCIILLGFMMAVAVATVVIFLLLTITLGRFCLGLFRFGGVKLRSAFLVLAAMFVAVAVAAIALVFLLTALYGNFFSLWSRGGDLRRLLKELDGIQKRPLFRLFPGCALACAGNGSKILRNWGIGFLGLAAAQDGDVGIGVGNDGIRLFFQPYLDSLAKQVHLNDGASSVGGIHKGISLGGRAEQILISVLLVFQTAHQTATGAGNFGGIQT